jgi:hypothetical protein
MSSALTASLGSGLVPLQNSGNGGGILLLMIYLGILLAYVVGKWKTFNKAGYPGWAAIVPIYNLYVRVKIGGHSGWWVLLFFVPLVNILIVARVNVDIAKRFGKDVAYGLGLTFLPFIFFLSLGLGDATYEEQPTGDS